MFFDVKRCAEGAKPLRVAYKNQEDVWVSLSNFNSKHIKVRSLDECIIYLQQKIFSLKESVWYIFDGETNTFYVSSLELKQVIISEHFNKIFNYSPDFIFNDYKHKDEISFVVGFPTTEMLNKNKRTYVYMRVSTGKQTNDNQQVALQKYVDIRGIKVHEWIEEIVSGKVNAKDRLLGGLIEKLKSGDTILVSEMSRLGRKLHDILQTVNTLLTKGVNIILAKESVVFDGSDTMKTSILSFAFGLCAEMERTMISQRTKEGLQRLKDNGVKLGRPKNAITDEKKLKCEVHKAKILEYRALGMSISSIARNIGVHRETLNLYLKKLNGVGDSSGEIRMTKTQVKDANIKEIKKFLKENEIPPHIYQTVGFWERNYEYLITLKKSYTYNEISSAVGVSETFIKEIFTKFIGK